MTPGWKEAKRYSHFVNHYSVSHNFWVKQRTGLVTHLPLIVHHLPGHLVNHLLQHVVNLHVHDHVGEYFSHLTEWTVLFRIFCYGRVWKGWLVIWNCVQPAWIKTWWRCKWIDSVNHALLKWQMKMGNRAREGLDSYLVLLLIFGYQSF